VAHPGVLHNPFVDAGIPCFTTEIGATCILDCEMIALVVERTLNVLKHYGAVSGSSGGAAMDAGASRSALLPDARPPPRGRSAGRSHTFEAGGDIDAAPRQVAVGFLDGVARMEADFETECTARHRRPRFVRPRRSGFRRRAHGVDHALKGTMAPSPVRLTTLLRRAAMAGSRRSLHKTLNFACVPSSSARARREWPAISAMGITASLRTFDINAPSRGNGPIATGPRGW
jgi:hypothetical protein